MRSDFDPEIVIRDPRSYSVYTDPIALAHQSYSRDVRKAPGLVRADSYAKGKVRLHAGGPHPYDLEAWIRGGWE